MRVYVTVPDSLLDTLKDQAHAAHRSPRYQLEWLIRQALQEQSADERRSLFAPGGQSEEEAYATE
ncbi:MAG TPA: hypothetical protein VIH59_14930 [Candidatus Tectomicrobia bacterium]|jgi:hypothetical protein